MIETRASWRAREAWRGRRSWPAWVGTLAPVAALLYVVLHRSVIAAGVGAVGNADRDWLAVGAAAVVLIWAASSSSQAGAVEERLALRPLLATQVAGGFLNHILPAGIGKAGLTLRLLRRTGLSLERAAGAIALTVAAGAIVHAGELLVVLGLDPHIVHLGSRHTGLGAWSIGIGTGIIVGVVVVAAVRARRSARVRLALVAARSVLGRPSRAALLWGGSIAQPALHTITLIAVLHALHHPAPMLTVAGVYLGSSALSAAVPTPGGFGGLDIALVSGLVNTGLSATSAAAVVIAYRALTVWLPLIPGGLVFGLMFRRRADACPAAAVRDAQQPDDTPPRCDLVDACASDAAPA